MPKSSSIVEGWIRLAFSDWKALESIDLERNKGVAVYHIQQFVEKLLKAVISALGLDVPKTHYPSKYIDSIIADYQLGERELKVPEDALDLLEKISNMAKSIEDEGVRPRYGIKLSDRIILPEELYSMDIIKLYLKEAKNLAKLVAEFLKKIGLCENILELCEELKSIW